ncbi:MAG: hypothetical protein J6K33_04325 [Alistipes sp.]|nr:hypothetical protein [Alistipes sp.]
MKRFIFCIVALVAMMGNQAVAAELAAKAPKGVEISSQSVTPYTIKVSCKGEAFYISASEQWLGVVGGDVMFSAKRSHNVKIWAEPNLTTDYRSALLELKGVKSGKVKQIAITQPPYLKSIVDGFPVRMMGSRYDAESWEASGICSPKGSSAMIAMVGASGNLLTTTSEKGVAVAGVGAGDYLLFAVPVAKAEAGEQFDFMCTMTAMEEDAPKYWIFEYWDAGRWNSLQSELRCAEDNSAIRYSFYNKYFRSAHNTSFAQSFTISEPIENGCVKVRLRALTGGNGKVKLTGNSKYVSLQLIRYNSAPKVADTKRMLFIGNSFTYFYGTPFMFKEIARSQGHQVDAVISVKGGQEFSEHLQLERSREAIMQGGFDYAFLQDTSPNAAKYADTQNRSILKASRAINELTRKYSPNCEIIYEQTWACPHDDYRGYGSYERLDSLLQRGSQMLAAELAEFDIVISPIGEGFKIGRAQNLTLLHTDNRHQSREGAYLKACINYLLIYKQPFTTTVSDCGVKRKTAAIIRKIAEQVVLSE